MNVNYGNNGSIVNLLLSGKILFFICSRIDRRKNDKKMDYFGEYLKTGNVY